jgi:peptidoglycan/LPS O-acetylase OafA/YrhL
LTSVDIGGDGYENIEEQRRESFCKVCCCGDKRRGCCSTLCDRFKSIFQRRPSSLEPLDGLRAIAVMLVVGTHALIIIHPDMSTCVRNAWFPLFSPFGNGDLGVDIFFVLSGFLIGYILLKECENHDGELDVKSFIRSRFIRIWPAMCVYITLMTPLIGAYFKCDLFTAFLKFWLTTMTFICNYLGYGSHLWSVAVEFQMYLLSPFYVKWIYKN